MGSFCRGSTAKGGQFTSSLSAIWEGFQEPGVEYGGFADDLSIWIQGSSLSEIEGKASRAIEKIEKWAEELDIILNPNKSVGCLFSSDVALRDWNPGFQINGGVIRLERKVRLLGVTFDQTMSFNDHVESVCLEMKKRAGVLRCLSGREWGWRKEELKQVYVAMGESV